MHAYQTIVTYHQDEPIAFADFTLRFTGISTGGHLPNSQVRMGDHYHFVASQGSESVDLIWSSGTGDIGPARFTIGGVEYYLELMATEQAIQGAGKTGSLADDQLVVTPRKDYALQN